LLPPCQFLEQVALPVPAGATRVCELIVDPRFASRVVRGAKIGARTGEHFLIMSFPELRVDLGKHQPTAVEDPPPQAAKATGPVQGFAG
jgi:hypothetical protein